eukprot:scaffold1241_cov227-Pinguiococcus_pyrenoidosus.AAC.2
MDDSRSIADVGAADDMMSVPEQPRSARPDDHEPAAVFNLAGARGQASSIPRRLGSSALRRVAGNPLPGRLAETEAHSTREPPRTEQGRPVPIRPGESSPVGTRAGSLLSCSMSSRAGCTFPGTRNCVSASAASAIAARCGLLPVGDRFPIPLWHEKQRAVARKRHPEGPLGRRDGAIEPSMVHRPMDLPSTFFATSSWVRVSLASSLDHDRRGFLYQHPFFVGRGQLSRACDLNAWTLERLNT